MMLTGLFITGTGALAAQTQGSAFTAAAGPIQTVGSTDKKPESTAGDPEKIDVLVKEVREQKEMIDKLYQIVADQQKKLGELSANLATATAPVHKIDISDNDPQTDQTPLEARVKKVEDQVLRFGNLRFSGDFRLRADGIFRQAEPIVPAGFDPIQHAQNVRMRYRFRFNMDTDVSSKLSFHAQLATGPINNPLTNDQDFSATIARAPFFISEAWIDYHPNKALQLQGGRVVEVFADNSRFLFDDDARFNGFNEKYTWAFKNKPAGISSIEFRAGQYILSNPNVAIVTPGSPLAMAGAEIGSIGRSSNIFHQGLLVNHSINEKYSQQFGADVQIYRNPNQIALASTVTGAVLIVYPGLGLTLSGPLTGSGTGTTTPGGAIFTARNFDIGRFTYRLNYAGFKHGDHNFPVVFNVQAARNFGTGQPQRDAFLANATVGKITKRGDTAFTYIFAIKGANSMISQLTDDDLGTNSGVNIRTHHFRFDYGLSKRVSFQSLIFLQKELRSSGDYPNFFVPLNAFAPHQLRVQEQIVFSF